MAITKMKIFPPIGFARVGNSPDEFFIGPEIPGLPVRPEGGYKDQQCRIKRQAARFRIYAYDENGTLVKEITETDGDIDWTVQLANGKAAFHGNDPSRKINPGPRTLNGPLQSAKFNNGTFTIPGSAPAKVELGEIRTDDQGRLLVLGGFGKSFSPNGSGMGSYLSNPNWTDDTSDGPISAIIKLAGGATFQAEGAWVIVGPPRFAPEIPNVMSMYDRLYNYQNKNVSSAKFPVPATPSFKNDVFPILQGAVLSNWITGYPVAGQNPDPTNTDHHAAFSPDNPGFQNLASNSSSPPASIAREHTYNALRTSGGSPANMPDLLGASGSNLNYAGYLRLTEVQMAIMEKWKDGNFVADWGSYTPPSPSDPITPEGLLKSSLENAVGGSFFPGIEAGKVLVPKDFSNVPSYATGIYLSNEPFRLDHTKLNPGDVTRDMAVPWQADFTACTGCWWTGGDWWPVQRPRKAQVWNDALKKYEFKLWARDADGSYQQMVDNWNNLGFVLKETVDGKKQFIETERCDSGSIMLLTPSVQFKDIPTGHGGTTRVTKRLIMFDVVSPTGSKTFTVKTAPTNSNLSVTGAPFTVNNTGTNSTELLIPIQFTASSSIANPISDSVTIACTETGQSWKIPITASVSTPKTAGVVLVLDISGSMSAAVSATETRMSILRKAAISFIDHMQDGDGIGIVVYNHQATVLQNITTINPSTKASTIATLQSSALNPNGYTSIGSGINKARMMLNGISSYDFEAMVVVTDGQENTAPYIRDVAANIHSDTFSVGIGQAQNISVAPLQALSNNTGGYFLITGLQTNTNQLRLQKYFLQILSSITNRNILLDPDGIVQPGEEHKIPFTISDAESWVDVSLLHSDVEHLRFALEAPNGQWITPENVKDVYNAEYTQGEHSAFYRIHAPISFGDRRYVWPGHWNAVLEGTGNEPTHYSVVVHGHSEVHFEAHANMNVGSDGHLQLSATLTEHDLIFEHPARIWGELTNPKGVKTKLELQQDVDGHYSASYHPKQVGHFDLRLRAVGNTQDGEPFMREKHLTFNLQHIEPEDPTLNKLDPDHPVINPGNGYMVLGEVRLPDGVDPGELSIKVFDKDARSKTELGQCSIDAQGNYQLPYLEKVFRKTKKERGGADLMVWVYRGDKVIHKVKTHYDAPKVSVIDVDLHGVI